MAAGTILIFGTHNIYNFSYANATSSELDDSYKVSHVKIEFEVFPINVKIKKYININKNNINK